MKLFFYTNHKMFSYSSFLNKHLKLYNIDDEYTEFINKFLYEHLLNFILNYKSDDIETLTEIRDNTEDEDSDDHKECENCNKIKEEYEQMNIINLKKNEESYLKQISELNQTNNKTIEKINETHKKEILDITKNHKKEINTLNEKLVSIIDSKHDLENEILDITQKHRDELKVLNDNLISEIKLKHELENKLLTMTSKKSITLGNEGEKELFEIFKSMNKHVIDKHKTSHACDMWIVDDEHKILYVIESKNKKRIIQEDIVKFNFDLDYIPKNLLIGEHKTYKIIGLFISLNSDSINNEIGSFLFDLDKTYITNNYVFKEFFEIYFKSIECLIHENNIKSRNEVIDLISNEYKTMAHLIDLCNDIDNNANKIVQNSTMIKKELSKRIHDFKQELINIENETSKQILIENEIKTYILECVSKKTKISIKKIKEQIKNTNIFEGKKITSAFLINWAKSNSF